MLSTLGKVPEGYDERVYAGVLGKMIGVYMGRPIEGWSNERIEREIGEVWYYPNEQLGMPLIVADDDLSGTFTFLRALPDHGVSPDLTAEAIGKTWLNYLVENRTVLWWGGVGVSTEHTAYYRLKSGVPAPLSGSMERNGQVVAEQIGAQIFVDGWAMVCPNDPETAVTLAGRAASVSHDGEAIFAAQFIAAVEAMAFGEGTIASLLTRGQTFIPPGSLIYQIVDDVTAWHSEDGRDWRLCLRRVTEKYGYEIYGGNCHVVPNFALIILALLFGDNDFQKSQMIVNTCGWDTDCNAANVGCILGIKNGLAAINAKVDFTTPVADRLYLPTADGGQCITDAAQVANDIAAIGYTLRGQKPDAPNGGARFHFNFPGSLQGFQPEDSAACRGVVSLTNAVVGRVGETGEVVDERALAIAYKGVGRGRNACVYSPTFMTPDALKGGGGYGIEGSPTIYGGQILRARVVAHDDNADFAPVTLVLHVYGDKDALETVRVATHKLAPGDAHHFHAPVPDTEGKPIAAVGLEIGGDAGSGTVFLDWMNWDGAPTTTLTKKNGTAWRKAWVNAASEWCKWVLWEPNQFTLVQNNADTGFALTGCREWTQYQLETTVYAHLVDRVGVLVCGRGLRRYVAVTLSPGGIARLVERYDDAETVLAEAPIEWSLDLHYRVTLSTKRDGTIKATVEPPDPSADPVTLTGLIDTDRAFGGIGLLVAGGHAQFGAVSVSPIG
ncbi:MAG: ADP-ribosylglycohydrolase family protein [Armatimonadetes bacterium]|nr:ADP-ribosylglycohydrolase family protein [Armatimonadota bacterium]